MTTRVANYLFLAVFVAVGAAYLWQSRAIHAANPDAGFGPILFPVLLGAALVVLCLAELALTALRGEREAPARIALPNAGLLAATVLLTGLYFLAWEWTGAFYPVTGVYFLALAVLYGRGRTPRDAAIAVAASAGFALALYLVFDRLFHIPLG